MWNPFRKTANTINPAEQLNAALLAFKKAQEDAQDKMERPYAGTRIGFGADISRNGEARV